MAFGPDRRKRRFEGISGDSFHLNRTGYTGYSGPGKTSTYLFPIPAGGGDQCESIKKQRKKNKRTIIVPPTGNWLPSRSTNCGPGVSACSTLTWLCAGLWARSSTSFERVDAEARAAAGAVGRQHDNEAAEFLDLRADEAWESLGGAADSRDAGAARSPGSDPGPGPEESVAPPAVMMPHAPQMTARPAEKPQREQADRPEGPG